MSPKFDEKTFYNATGCRHRCFSYAYCGIGSPLASARYARGLELCLQLGVNVFLDSGAHTFHNMIYRGQTMTARANPETRRQIVMDKVGPYLESYSKYLRYCSQEGKKFDFYVTLDADRDCPIIWECTHKLEKLGTRPVPVYHGDQPLDWVKRYIDEGHRIIGVGLSRIGKSSKDGVRRYYETVLDLCHRHNVACHGFAVTGDTMFEYPFYSADSTTWVKAAGYGKILDIRPEKQRTALIHVSTRFSERNPFGQFENLSKGVRQYLIGEVERRGFNWDRIRTEFPYRAIYNAKILVEAVAAHTARKDKRHTKWSSVITV
jgi:hypothetical protein